jgi:WD40 repeat protein
MNLPDALGKIEWLQQQKDPLPMGAKARIGTSRFFEGRGVSGIAFSPDGRMLAGAEYEFVLLWDVATGKRLGRLSVPPPATFRQMAFLPKGRWLVTQIDEDRSGKGSILFWHLTPSTENPLQGPRSDFRHFALSTDGRILATSKGKSIRLWDIAACEQVGQLDLGYGADFLSLSADATLLASQVRDRRVMLWDVAARKALRIIPPVPLDGTRQPALRRDTDVSAFALSPNGRVLATVGGSRGPVTLWDSESSRQLHVLPTSDVSPRHLAFSPDGKLVSLSSQSALRLWEVATGKECWHASLSRAGVYSSCFSPDGRTIAAATDQGVGLWDVATGRQLNPDE